AVIKGRCKVEKDSLGGHRLKLFNGYSVPLLCRASTWALRLACLFNTTHYVVEMLFTVVDSRQGRQSRRIAQSLESRDENRIRGHLPFSCPRTSRPSNGHFGKRFSLLEPRGE